VEIEYQLGEEDLLAFSEYHLAHSPSNREVRRRKTYGYAVLLAVFCLILLLFGGRALAIAFLVLGPPWIAYWPWRVKQVQRRQLLARYREAKNPALDVPVVLGVDGDVLTCVTSASQSRMSCAAVQRVADTLDHVFVYLGPEQALIVPRRRVSRGDVDIFVQELRNRTGAPS
jgi:hypothetical protein